MAKSVRTIILTLSNGDTRAITSKTCTEKYIRSLIADLILPCHVVKWEVLA